MSAARQPHNSTGAVQEGPPSQRNPGIGQGVANANPQLSENTDSLTGTWGDQLGSPQQDTLRIGHLNVNGLGKSSCRFRCNEDASCKQCNLRCFLTSKRFDIVGITECNVHWKLVDVSDRLPERTRGWWESLHLNTAYYKDYPAANTYQVGGVSLWSTGKAAHRVMETGSDPRKLGRWAWTRYRGKQGVSLRFVTAYRPVLNKNGVGSAWNQQKAHFENNSEDRCPRAMFTIDICREIEKWLLNGDQIAIGIDANEDVRAQTPSSFSHALRRLGLVEAIIDRHGRLGPPTFHLGSHPVDGFYVTSTLLGLPCGYTEYLTSDHRLLWMDVPTSNAFGYSVPQIVTANARRLKCQDPRVVKAYLEEYGRILTETTVFSRVVRLHEQAVELSKQGAQLPENLANEWEEIDTIQVAAMKQAERRCRKYRTGAIEWSPTYQRACRQRDLLNLLAKKLRGGRVDGRFLRRKAKAASMQHALLWSQQEVLSARDAHYQDLREIKQNASTKRLTWMQGLARARAASRGTRAEQEVLDMISREKTRREWRQIRYAEGKVRGSCVSMVIAPNENNEWTERTDRTDIEDAVFKEMDHRFNQAKDTPFLNGPLFELLGPLGTGEAAEAILNGTFIIPPEVDEYTAKFIKQLRRPPEVTQMSLDLPIQSYQQGWGKARENTASGPSGLHFGHFKAGARDPGIAEFERQMSHIPYITGHSPNRWRKVIDYLLEKKQGNFYVNKLRIILFFEADCNQNNKKLGRDMNYGAERAGTLAPEQYGSRKNLSAIDHCLNKQLTLDLARLKKVALALCANDAKSCYDRIVHAVASLCMQRQGVPLPPIICMFVTLQNLEHHVRTVYGDSEQFYCGAKPDLWAVPAQGVGQGNGAGPQIWAVVSTPVLNMLREEGFGVFFKTAISGGNVHFVAYAFVDDTDLCTTLQDPKATGAQVARTMQETLNLWEGGIRATGGAIEPSKTYWYLMDYKWREGEWRYSTETECPAVLTVRDCNGQLQTLDRLSPSEARRTLGVYLAPDGNQREQVRVMHEKSKQWAERIRTGHLPRHLAWQALHLSVLKSLQYPLTATTLSRKECKYALQPALQAGLPSSGIVRTMPRVVVHGPKCYQGFGIPNLYTLQGTAHVTALISRGTLEHFNGQLLRANIEQAKLEVGLVGSLFAQDYSKYESLLTNCWIKNTWLFLSENDITLEDSVPDIRLRRQRDSSLTTEFVRAGYTGQTLRRLNLCRLFLKVFTVSDIVTASGTQVTTAAWEGKVDETSISPYEWPNQGRPGVQDWNLWRTALKKTFRLQGPHSLAHPLGLWLDTENQCKWFFEPTEERLYEHGTNQWWYYPKRTGRPTRRSVMKFRERIQCDECPNSAQRASVVWQGTILTLTGYQEAIASEVIGPPTFQERLLQVHDDAKWAVQKLVSSDDGRKIADAILAHECIGISDGSFKPGSGLGTAAFTIEGRTKQGCISGECITPGYAEDQSAYRSEASGLYAMATVISLVCEHYNIQQGTVELACDGKDALLDSMDPKRIIDSKKEHYDILMATRAVTESCPVKWKFRHVYGHQDGKPEKEMTRWELLNCEMDARAKGLLRSLLRDGDHEQRQIRIFKEPWPLWINGRKACRDIGPLISEQVDGKPLLDYMKKKGKMGTAEYTEVDWEAVEGAMKSVPQNRRIWISKHVSTFCGTGVNMKKWNKRDNSNCPRCHAEDEDVSHVWKCQSQATHTVWNDALTRLETWMQDEDTNEYIRDAILTGLRSWRNDTPTEHGSTEVRAQMAHQQRIGWEALLEGRPAAEWRNEQERHFRSKPHCLKTGKRWAIALIKKLWDTAWTLWDHRNRVLHDNETSLERQELAEKIQEQFRLGTNTLPRSVRQLFREGSDSILRRPTLNQKAWLHRITSARQRAQERIDQGLQSFNAERNFFQRWLTTGRGIAP
jgi:hypothetical protein